VKSRIPLAATLVIAIGAALRFGFRLPEEAHWIWVVGLIVTAAPLVVDTVQGVLRGKLAADLVASITIVVALVLDHPIVGLLIVIMQSGGEALERIAEGKAGDALHKLESQTPRTVHRYRNGAAEDIDAASMRPDEIILVRPGEMIPCDGIVTGGSSHADTSTLTGEPMPRSLRVSTPVMSGWINQESPLTIRATAAVEESQYARIVALVRAAQASKAPLQRIADRVAVWFTPITLAACAIAYALSSDWERVLAVLAIATPCPLILATPVAIIGGMNSSARRQILVRSGGALEALGRTTAVIFDKTGTVTIGRPCVSRVVASDSVSEPEMLRLASAVEQGSGHLLARTLIAEATERKVSVAPATEVVESPGRGVEGIVGTVRVAVGARSFIAERYPSTVIAMKQIDSAEQNASTLRAYVAVNGMLSGFVEYADIVREGIPSLVSALKAEGVRQVMLISGDRAETTAAVAQSAGIDEWRADMLPQDKVEVVKRLLDDGESVVMLGDGTNDAPALSTATVGVALASHGRGIATESADVILLADEPARLLDAIRISRRTMRIARQSIGFGLAISAIGIVFAALGRIVPIGGAAIQEAVDLGVILNALRASRT
jgi:heavy metal translocating P-type ATPase